MQDERQRLRGARNARNGRRTNEAASATDKGPNRYRQLKCTQIRVAIRTYLWYVLEKRHCHLVCGFCAASRQSYCGNDWKEGGQP